MPTTTRDIDRIAAIVRFRRAERGWGQGELANRASLSARMIRVVEGAERPARAATYGRIALALEIPLAELLGEEPS